ncbi:M56 family metallopeptidase [Corallococcus exiguus]|uniref:M56 family metallopeptidase n=1 Tax=Corallococcus TaxID=83461 RepID=UPI000EE420DF|nr:MULTISPECIES: M56 family metallopeptidase [Corallococcus]NNB88498.1 M56 family metallopeptidase [Corallococcus exiguus]NNC04769.1 M56 family metallopeptidase [Corallococcus exiguus]NPC47773.1 M56 family metallopeptidase [Corallococcus exiguus]RKH85593.1 M56 family metallopeptidase [Corallococcus sp. AB032C]
MNGLVLEAVGWALVHLVWQGALVAVALALALRWVGRRSANLRYALACGALGIMLALPVATAWRHASRAVESRPVVSTASVPRTVAPMQARVSPALTQLPAPRHMKETATLPRLDGLFQQVGEHLPWLVLAWGLGVAASSLRLLKGWMGLRQQVDEAVHASWEWQQRLEVLARRLNLTRPVRLLVSSKLDVPSTLGWLKPVVLVPTATLTGLAVRELELVLAHELAHIRRHDFAVNVVQTLVETLLFYHPAVWWMSQVIRVERENCCDDLAVRHGPGALPYARALTALEALRLQGMDASGPALSALGGSLKDRVRRLVVAPTSRCSSRWAAGVSIVTLASSLALAVPLTALAVQPVKAPETKSLASPVVSVTPRPHVSVSAPVAVPVLAVGAAPPAPNPAPAPVVAPAPNPAPSPKEKARAARKDSDDADEKTRVGVDPLSVDQLVALKIAGVTPEVVDRITAMGYEPTVDTLVGFQHAGVTPDYVKSMADRFGRSIPAEQLVAMRHLGVTPEWLGQMAALGFDKEDSDELLSAKALGINAAWLNELKAAGFGKLSLDEAVQLRALGVDSSYLRELEAVGVKPATVDELVRLRTGGVDADFIRRMQKSRK